MPNRTHCDSVRGNRRNRPVIRDAALRTPCDIAAATCMIVPPPAGGGRRSAGADCPAPGGGVAS
jgi:hypothetical protein